MLVTFQHSQEGQQMDYSVNDFVKCQDIVEDVTKKKEEEETTNLEK